MLVRVMYRDLRYDYVDTAMLERLIESKDIRRFLRPIEDEWVELSASPTRGNGGIYTGPERRLTKAS